MNSPSSPARPGSCRPWPALLLLSLLPLLPGCQQKRAEIAPPPAPRVAGESVSFDGSAPQLAHITAESAQPRPTATVPIYGRLAWDEDVTVRIFSPVAGRVLGLQADVGDRVAGETVLARLASPDYGQAQADVQTAKSDVALTAKTVERARELFAHGAAAGKDLEAAEADSAKAASELQRAQAQHSALSRGQTDTVDGVYLLRTPLAGVVVERNLTPGQFLRSDLVLANAPQYTNPQFVVTDPTRLWLYLDVTDLDAASFQLGRAVLIHTPAYPDRVFRGKLDLIGQALDPSTRTLKVRALVENPDRLLKAEMYVTAEVVGDSAAGVEVSAKAVFLRHDQYYVFVEAAPGEFERRAVKLGSESGGRIALEEGVTPGQKVVIEGSLLLQAILDGNSAS